MTTDEAVKPKDLPYSRMTADEAVKRKNNHKNQVFWVFYVCSRKFKEYYISLSII